MMRLLTIFFMTFTFLSNAQVLNIDREVQNDSLSKNWQSSVSISFSSDKLKKSLADVSSRLETAKFFKTNYVLIGTLNNDLTVLGNDIIQNEGFLQLRYRDNDKRKWSEEIFTQYQWNGTLGMEYRQAIGGNLRLKVFDKKDFDFYTGLGFFYENEQWNWSGVNVPIIGNTDIRNRTLYRLNHYFKMAGKINDQIDISAVSYQQFPINNQMGNLRWYLDLNTNIKISKNTSCVIHWDHIYDDYRLVPITKFYYSLNFGFQLKW